MDELVRKALEEEHGLKIGRYLGHGGFAEVYEAESAQGVRCAVKVSLDRLDGSGPAMHKRNQALQKELENLHLVQTIAGHPHVVTLMDYWVIGGYLVTRWELATEGSLAELLAKHVQEGTQGIPLETLLRYTYEAADAIDFLNGQGIYHRDIKPENLLLFHGHVKVADLGLAKFAGASTASHTGLGTLGYIPPEANEDHRLTKTVDLYSLAATYVKLRTNRDPFGTTPHEILENQDAGNPVVEGLGWHEAQWVRRALASRPEDRPQEGAVAWVRGLEKASRAKSTPYWWKVTHHPQAPARRTSTAAISVKSGPTAASSVCVREPLRPPANRKFIGQAFLLSLSLCALLGIFAVVLHTISRTAMHAKLEEVAANAQVPTTTDRGRTSAPGSPSATGIDDQAAGNDQGQQAFDGRTAGHQGVAAARAQPNPQAPATSGDPINRPPTSAPIPRTTRKIGLLANVATFSAAMTPDGRRAVSGSEYGTVYVWDIESRRCVHQLRGHWRWVSVVAITPDGRRAISGSEDCTLRVWDLESGACLHELRGHTKLVTCLAITPDGRSAISGSEDCTLRVWDLESGVYANALRTHTSAVLRLAIAPDGRTVVSGSQDNTLVVWHLQRGTCLYQLRGHLGWVQDVAITPDGSRAVSGSHDGTLRVWDLESGACLHELRGHTDFVWRLAITPDGGRIVSAGYDKTLRVWDLQTGACIAELRGHTEKVWSLAITPDGRYALSGGTDGIRVWALP